ncbi:MAG: S-formylglutathione hydrolase [Candidatus Saccharibacteria bacterium]|nr:S-formylglutathione hydrolase [Moraxellaceae bacterium]
MQILNSSRCFNGEQRIYQHASTVIGLPMKFGVYLPPQALAGEQCAALFYLAGLTCTEETFAIKAHAQDIAAELGVILISPDTSPRGDNVAKSDSWDLGQGAGFYLDATEAPWALHYRMESYLIDELYPLIKNTFNVQRISIMGHSMGGHGALTLALRHPELFASVSAIAPIAAPMDCPWGVKAFTHYLGNDQTLWAEHDASRLIEAKGKLFDHILVDQGLQDQFLNQLHPDRLEVACARVGQPLNLRRHAGYDHGYYFIQSVIADHVRYHMQALR